MGLFDNGVFGSASGQRSGGVLGSLAASGKPSTWDIISMVASGLQDANAGYRGQKGGYLDANLQDLQGHRLREGLLKGLSSDDPAARQQAYQTATMLGIDPKPFQQQQAQKALGPMLQSMQPSTQTVAPTSAPLPNLPGQTVQGGGFSFQAPGLSPTEALTQSNSPELQQQYAPKVFEDALKGPDNTPHEGVNPDTGKLGQYILQNGQPQWLPVGVAPKAPKDRTIQRGLQTVTQQFDDATGQWRDIPNAIGPKFKPDGPAKTGVNALVKIPHPGSMY